MAVAGASNHRPASEPDRSPPDVPLQESLTREDRERLLEARDLRFTPPLPLFVSLCLGDTAVLDLLVVLQDSGQFGAKAVLVGSEFCDELVQAFELLGLVLDVLLLQGLCDLSVLRCRIRLLSLLLGEIRGEITVLRPSLS